MLKELFENKKILHLTLAFLAILPFEYLSLTEKHFPYLVELFFLVVIVITFGRDIYIKGIVNLFQLKFSSINLLMVVATIGAAYIGEIEEAAIIVILFSLGNALEDFGFGKSKSSLEGLIKNTPKIATLKSGETVNVENLKVNQIILLKRGDMVPVDGKILSGVPLVDEASVTGEPLPKTKTVTEVLFSGSIILDGYVELQVIKKFSDSTIQKIVKLTYEASERKSNTQVFIEKFAKYYTPLVLLSAVLLVLVPVVIFKLPFQKWFVQALTLLIISCPCALVISSPISIFSAVGNAARRGLIIKGGKFLEEMAKVKVFAFDKTRTLTKGLPQVVEVIPFGKNSSEEVIRCLAGLEIYSEHPLSKAVVGYAQKKNIDMHKVENFKATTGKGIEGICIACTESHRCAGTLSYISEKHGEVDTYVLKKAKELEEKGMTIIVLSDGKEVIGIVGLTDEIKSESIQVVQDLRNMGIRSFMLTGDSEKPAKFVADNLKLEGFYSSLLPEDKVKIINQLKNKFSSVVMVGDGINDAPALASSSVGIAMASAGSDIAIENADIAIMNDNLNSLPFLAMLSRKTTSTIRFNVTCAILTKLLFIILAILGYANLAIAIFADVGVTVFVVLNSLRLFK